jgi:hypothetical protein
MQLTWSTTGKRTFVALAAALAICGMTGGATARAAVGGHSTLSVSAHGGHGNTVAPSDEDWG